MGETHALLLRRAGRLPAIRFVRTVRESPNLVVTSTPELEEAAVHDWLEPHDDHDFSLVDAVSFAVMAERKINDALSLDRNFAVVGFRMVADQR